jgi:hypothetical protein
MANTIRTIIRRLATSGQAETVHFHQGPQGQPAPCFDTGCASPRLDV